MKAKHRHPTINQHGNTNGIHFYVQILYHIFTSVIILSGTHINFMNF